MKLFDEMIAKWTGNRPCALCGEPRGYGKPVIAIDHKFYHPDCGRQVYKAFRDEVKARYPKTLSRLAGGGN